MGIIFQKRLLDKYIEELLESAPPVDDIKEIIIKWKNFFEGRTELGEANLEQAFNEDFFISILGYTRPPSDSFTFLPKISAQAGRNIPDFLLGQFTLVDGQLDQNIRRVVGELKGPEIDLDKIDPSRNMTPVEQAFDYGQHNGIYMDWIIVSNMREIRLYKNTSIVDYEEFKINRFIQDNELTLEYWKFYSLLHHDLFMKDAPHNKVYNLLLENIEERVKISEAFYKYYRECFLDVYTELSKIHNELTDTNKGQLRISQSAQKVLHRDLLISVISDHPKRLLPKNILNELIETAKKIPILTENKIHQVLVDFFKCINLGSPGAYPYDIFGYDGGLFQEDELIDSIILPDSLYTKKYKLNGLELEGIYGFRKIDFYYEISPHILGRLFEHSLNDQEIIFKRVIQEGYTFLETFDLQRELGVIYTREVLTNYAARSSLTEIFKEKRNIILDNLFPNRLLTELSVKEDLEFWRIYMEELLKLRIIDISVGSGAFLVASYRTLKREISNAFEMQKLRGRGLHRFFDTWETELLDDCLYGKDIMGDAISIAKLSLWLSSITKDHLLNKFDENFIIGDSLSVPIKINKIQETDGLYEKYDLIIGNPPWGADISSPAKEYLSREFQIADIDDYDSYELFLLVAHRYLKNGGRLCYVLPHTLLYPEKEKTRKWLLENFQIEKWHYLGAEWFGPKIRMNTTVFQGKKKAPTEESTYLSMILVGDERRKAIKGILDLNQLEKSYAFPIPQHRSQISENALVELFRYETDDILLQKMEDTSVELVDLCDRGRGVELNKAGRVIRCPSCGRWLPPPSPVRNLVKDEWPKRCSFCEHNFVFREALDRQTLVSDDRTEADVIYIDGDSIEGRYQPLKYKGLRLGFDGINYKDESLYAAPKLFIRQAGVGISATYDESGAFCPQSVYVYRIKGEFGEIEHKFLLGVLQSRVITYYIFKKFGEIDASQAFSKLTHIRLAKIPIPIRNYDTEEWKTKHDRIVELVDILLEGGELGGTEDWQLERIVQGLYSLDTSENAYINAQLGLTAYHKAMKELFPHGPPPKPVNPLEQIKMI